MGASFGFGLGTQAVRSARPAWQPSLRVASPWRITGERSAPSGFRGDRVSIEMGLHRAREGAPERRLVLAVLLDALQIVAWGVSPSQSPRCVSDARDWILSDDTHWPFSFVNVCEVLDLAPPTVREYAGAWIVDDMDRSPELAATV